MIIFISWVHDSLSTRKGLLNFCLLLGRLFIVLTCHSAMTHPPKELLMVAYVVHCNGFHAPSDFSASQLDGLPFSKHPISDS